jgi:hypothetical protein
MDLNEVDLGTWETRGDGGSAYHPAGNETTLEGIVTWLNPKAKQAMFSAASHGLIKRKTWDGCAFNAAGKEISRHVSSNMIAAHAFVLHPTVVGRFISIWDSIPRESVSDEEATQMLRNAIEKAGLFTEARQTNESKVISKGKRVIKSVLFKGTETRMREEFEALMLANGIPGETEAVELFCGVR